MKNLSWLILLIAGLVLAECKNEKNLSYEQKLQRQRFEKDKTFRYADQSPIPEKKREFFHSLSYFSIDSTYRVKAEVRQFDTSEIINMAYSDGSEKQFEKFARLAFELKGQKEKLIAYKRVKTDTDTENTTPLFVPFYDSTNDQTTYKGGRYLDLKMPTQGTVVIDFNKAYNPYCVYNENYACPIPPEENRLSIPIKAGEKQFDPSGN